MEIDQNTHREAFEEYASKIIELESVEKVVLFGSVARESHGVNSDVDVMVKVRDQSQVEEIEKTAFNLSSEVGVPITPIIVSDDTDDQFMNTVEKEGVEYVRS